MYKIFLKISVTFSIAFIFSSSYALTKLKDDLPDIERRCQTQSLKNNLTQNDSISLMNCYVQSIKDIIKKDHPHLSNEKEIVLNARYALIRWKILKKEELAPITLQDFNNNFINIFSIDNDDYIIAKANAIQSFEKHQLINKEYSKCDIEYPKHKTGYFRNLSCKGQSLIFIKEMLGEDTSLLRKQIKENEKLANGVDHHKVTIQDFHKREILYK